MIREFFAYPTQKDPKIKRHTVRKSCSKGKAECVAVQLPTNTLERSKVPWYGIPVPWYGIPGMGTYNPWSWHLQKATNLCFSFALMFLSLPLLSLPLSLKAMKKYPRMRIFFFLKSVCWHCWHC